MYGVERFVQDGPSPARANGRFCRRGSCVLLRAEPAHHFLASATSCRLKTQEQNKSPNTDSEWPVRSRHDHPRALARRVAEGAATRMPRPRATVKDRV